MVKKFAFCSKIGPKRNLVFGFFIHELKCSNDLVYTLPLLSLTLKCALLLLPIVKLFSFFEFSKLDVHFHQLYGQPPIGHGMRS
jgi:hypothetical protein